MDLQINAEFAPKLRECLFADDRYIIIYGGRGGGKSWAIARALLLRGLVKPLRILCVREFMSSVADSVHKLLSDQIFELCLADYYTIEKGTIFGRNGTEFRFAGIRNNVTQIKSFEGIDICWAEEAQNVSKASWEVLVPTIRKTGSQIIVSFNPEGQNDETYQRFVVKPPPYSRVVKINYDENPWFPEVLRREAEYLKASDPDLYQNVWLGFPRIALDKAIYARELRELQEEGRICKVPYDNSIPVNTFWDLGRADHTAIIFAQVVAMEFRVIDYIQDSGKSIHDYIKQIQTKPYIYGTDFLPHDARAKTLGTRRSIEEIMRSNGRKVQIVPRLSIQDGINAARSIFPRVYVDELKCAKLLECLRNYRWDDSDRPKPVHDVYCHGSDAWRYMSLSLNPPKPKSEDIRTTGYTNYGVTTGWMA
jgi:phage terminase large subunit